MNVGKVLEKKPRITGVNEITKVKEMAGKGKGKVIPVTGREGP
jgi:hypothetical protein